jgi:hypothetical protein
MVTLFRQRRDADLKLLIATMLRRLIDDLEPDAVAMVLADHFDPATPTAFKIVPEIVNGRRHFNMVGRR